MEKNLTLNYHLTNRCNYQCRYCFCKSHENELSKGRQIELIRKIGDSNQFKKINFAGGEPFLVPHLGELVSEVAKMGMEPSIITNGSILSLDWFKEYGKWVKILGVSIDSEHQDTLKNLGRGDGSFIEKLTDLIQKIKKINPQCRIKVNTVVTRLNFQENLTSLIKAVNPFRWKILQVLGIEGKNDKEFQQLKISQEEFQIFLQRHHGLKPIMIPEDQEAMTDSYLMMDAQGRFFQNTQGKYYYSRSLLKVPLQDALSQIFFNTEKFISRGGFYEAG